MADRVGVGDAEQVLLAAALTGDQAAIGELCRLCWKPVYRSLARHASSPAEAEDMTQEVFLRALKALPNFVNTGVPYVAYLLRIADNLVRDRWRREPGRFQPTDDLSGQTWPGPDPADAAMKGNQRAELLAALDQISSDQRKVLRLRVLEGRPTDEVAALINRSPAAVRQLQVRALASLRAALGPSWNAEMHNETGDPS